MPFGKFTYYQKSLHYCGFIKINFQWAEGARFNRQNEENYSDGGEAYDNAEIEGDPDEGENYAMNAERAIGDEDEDAVDVADDSGGRLDKQAKFAGKGWHEMEGKQGKEGAGAKAGGWWQGLKNVTNYAMTLQYIFVTHSMAILRIQSDHCIFNASIVLYELKS